MKIIDVEIHALEQVVLTTLCVPLSITKQSVFVQNHQPGTHMMNALPLLKVRIRAFLVDSSTMVEWQISLQRFRTFRKYISSYIRTNTWSLERLDSPAYFFCGSIFCYILCMPWQSGFQKHEQCSGKLLDYYYFVIINRNRQKDSR